jgi:hypothetical protein
MQFLINSPTTLKLKLKMVDTVIRPGIAYSFYAVAKYNQTRQKKLAFKKPYEDFQKPYEDFQKPYEDFQKAPQT